MFTTLRFNKDRGSFCVQKESYHPGRLFPNSGNQRSACDSCREKKLRCAGDKVGCDRCQSKNLPCTYSRSTGDDRRKQGKSGSSAVARTRPTSSSALVDGAQNADTNKPSETGATSPLIVDAISPELLDLALKDSYAYSDDAHTPAKGPALGLELQVAEQSRSLELPSLSSSSSFQPPEPPGLTPPDNSFMLDMVDFDSVLSGLGDCGQGPVDPTLVEHLSVPAADSIPLPPKHLTTVASCNSCSSSRSSYQCMKNVLRLHEEVESRRSATSMAPVDQWLSFQKVVLRQCRDILGCGSCHGISEIAMLLITVCGRLLDGFHGGLRQRSGTHGPNHGPSHSSHRYNGKVLIGEYGVDCPQEQTLLISNVMELRLRDLHSVLTQLGEIAMCEGWDKHVARLHQICADVQKEIVGLRKSTEYIMDEW